MTKVGGFISFGGEKANGFVLVGVGMKAAIGYYHGSLASWGLQVALQVATSELSG
jgi:hypothetical protein